MYKDFEISKSQQRGFQASCCVPISRGYLGLLVSMIIIIITKLCMNSIFKGEYNNRPDDHGPKDRELEDLAVLHLAFVAEMQLESSSPNCFNTKDTLHTRLCYFTLSASFLYLSSLCKTVYCKTTERDY